MRDLTQVGEGREFAKVTLTAFAVAVAAALGTWVVEELKRRSTEARAKSDPAKDVEP